VHEEGYQVARGVDGALRFTRPDGRPIPERPDQESGHDDILFDLVVEDDQDHTPAA
jgi:hypothetical protein